MEIKMPARSPAIPRSAAIAGAAAGLTGAVQMGYGACLSALVGWLLGGGESPYPLFTVQVATSWAALGIAVLLVAVAVARLTEDTGPAWFYVWAAAMGLGLASSPLFYGGLVTLVTALLL